MAAVEIDERDAVRIADAQRERADLLERGDEPTGRHDVSPEARAIAALTRQVGDLQEQLVRRTTTPPPAPVDRSSDAEFGRTVRKGIGAWKLIATLVLSLGGVAGWVELRVRTIAEDVYEDPERVSAWKAEVGELIGYRLSPLDIQLHSIDERTKRIENKIDAQRGAP